MAILFPLLHVAMGVGLTYSTIAGFFNRTVVTLNDTTLEVWNGPVPWFGNVAIPVSAIEQLYCTHAGQNRAWGKGLNLYQPPLFTLNALLINGRKQLLLRAVDREEALYIEQQLEDWLEIEPAHVPGQVE
jgi:hypothetical protein